jgi:Tfp pilus assembly pilus retraction ATPase PilT
MPTIVDLLKLAEEQEATAIALCAGRPPRFRRDGILSDVDCGSLSNDILDELAAVGVDMTRLESVGAAEFEVEDWIGIALLGPPASVAMGRAAWPASAPR